MSLFGEIIPYKLDINIPDEVKEFLETVVEEMYQDVEVVMFFEIFTHLPGKYLEIFVI